MLLTDIELRARWRAGGASPVIKISKDAILTPAARDFIKEHNITVEYSSSEVEMKSMSRTPIPVKDGQARYVDAETGIELNEKPEEMTHLRGNILVSKCHPQIRFRGKLDTLLAVITGVQKMAAKNGETALLNDLKEIKECTQSVLAAEVKDSPLLSTVLLGMNSEEIRHTSHYVKECIGIDHPVPDYEMPEICVALNYLRTQVRECELAASDAFTDGTGCHRKDIIEALNRLSSCVYIIFCRKLAGYYEGGTSR